MEWIVHICERSKWREAQAAGEYRAPSLEVEGFIHCSRPDQMLVVVNHFYADVPDLVLLWIDPKLLKTTLSWDAVGEEVYPHIYGPINLGAVQGVVDLIPGADGVYRHIPEL